MQFSSDTDGADFRPPPSDGQGDRDMALAILDDFGADRNDPTKTVADGNADKQHDLALCCSDDDGDLWPEAAAVSVRHPICLK